ncbi:uncharacterized protein PAC_14461 [Phialocephala subalpina]|uniref:Zn(2)-C6 fungal-type domain-containing protein n=1 Tax=Phialocephala subalpina TaxID=576137 RepID=A0A1L7XHN9_9HELO|nr:uncharacterized protein PAC_14461 [Phialocephala subalpina]
MQKQRVSRACDTCKRRKIRCTGKQPCAHCIKNNKTCEFKAAYTRGAVPEVQSAPLEEQEKFLEEVGYKRRQVWRPSPTRRSFSHVQATVEDEEEEETVEEGDIEYVYLSENDHVHTILPTRQPQELSLNPFSRPQTQTYRRATTANDSAGTSLYERTQDHLNRRDYHQKNPISAYGDPALPEIDTSFLLFPSESTAQALVARFFDFVTATNQILHRPTVERWLSELLSNIRGMRTGSKENSQRAVVLMVFASTHEYMDDEEGEWDTNTSFYYFQAAENQLTKETGEIRLATLQARLLQCMYLLSRSRINQCYSIFGTIVNFVYTLGLHRERRHSSTSDLLEIEMQKRVFWSAYIMDKYLSSSLGRPQLLRDEDIDQQLPLLVEDDHLTPGFLQTVSKDAQNPMQAAVYQIKLSKILSKVLRELYGIQKSSLETRFAVAGKLNAALRKWQSETAHFLDLDPSLLSPLYRRQNMALHLSYSQALIILHRPFLLDNFDSHLDIAVPVLRAKLLENIHGCLDAALEVVKTIDAMYRMNQSFSASWVIFTLPFLKFVELSDKFQFSHYIAYTAIVALYVYVIKRCTPCPSNFSSETPLPSKLDCSAWMPHFEAASRCQEQIKNSSNMAKESFAQKCSLVLEKLRAEAVVKIRQAQNKESTGFGYREQESRTENEMEEEEAEEEARARPARNESLQHQMGETSFFSGEWNDMSIDQSAPGGGLLYSLFLFNGVEGIHNRSGSGSLVDRIDRWGFSSLTGY